MQYPWFPFSAKVLAQGITGRHLRLRLDLKTLGLLPGNRSMEVVPLGVLSTDRDSVAVKILYVHLDVVIGAFQHYVARLVTRKNLKVPRTIGLVGQVLGWRVAEERYPRVHDVEEPMLPIRMPPVVRRNHYRAILDGLAIVF